MDPQGVRGGHKSVEYTINNVFIESFLDGLGVRKDHFIIFGVREAKKVKNHCPTLYKQKAQG